MATIPLAVAKFETTLASKISSSAATCTLASATTDDGTTIVTGTYGLVFDEGKSNEEFAIVTVIATAVTFVTRGVSVVDGTTNIAARQFEHRRGASVKITNHPVLIRLLRILNGTDTLDNKLSYTSHPTFNANTQIIDKKYADDLAIAGAPDASTVVKGILEAATDAELQAGTATGGTGALLAATGASFKQAGTANKVPVGDSAGKLASSWGGAASTLATLDGSSKVVENPANATATPGASKIPISGGANKLAEGWLQMTDAQAASLVLALTTRDVVITPVTFASSTAENTIYTKSIAGGTLGTTGVLRLKLYLSSFGLTNTKTATFTFKYGATSYTTLVLTNGTAGTYDATGNIEFLIIANAATNAQQSVYSLQTKFNNNDLVTQVGSYLVKSSTSAEDSTAAKTMAVTCTFNNSSASDKITVINAILEKI